MFTHVVINSPLTMTFTPHLIVISINFIITIIILIIIIIVTFKIQLYTLTCYTQFFRLCRVVDYMQVEFDTKQSHKSLCYTTYIYKL